MTERPLFDDDDVFLEPESAEARASRVEPAGPAILSVSELTALLKEVIETGFADVAVAGEVSNLSRPRSGHVYFDIKDEGAKLRAILWRSQAARVPFRLEDGLAVRAFGGLDVYPKHGAYQLIVRRIEPEGVGPLELAFRQLRERLQAEGLFDPDRKRPLPRFPMKIAVVASPTGAAVRDVLTVTGRRWPCAEVFVAPAKVQGLGAAEELAAAIRLANRVADLDLIILARGGGSLEDLWAFNEEVLARAILGSRVPILTGVGHETDLTIADLVADARAPTPSAAAELAVPVLDEALGRLDALGDRLARALARKAAEARSRLEGLEERARRAIAFGLERRQERAERLDERLRRAIEQDLRRRADRLAGAAGRLEALSPLGVLARGYSLTQREADGRIVRSPADVRPGERIRSRLASGSLWSRVEEPPADADSDSDSDSKASRS